MLPTMNKSHRHHVEKKPEPTEYVMYDYVNFKNKQMVVEIKIVVTLG
jgi:hypothetical protein